MPLTRFACRIDAMSISKRITQEREKKGWNQSELARALSSAGQKVTPQSVQQWEKGETAPRPKKIAAMAQLFGVDAAWLQYGTSSNVEAPAAHPVRKIPVINYVQAGSFREVIDDFAPGDGMFTATTDQDLGPHAFGLIIRGESMLPEFKDGDMVIIDPAVSPHPGDFVVAKCNGNEATFKKYRPRGIDENGAEVFELVPLNEDYPTFRSDATMQCEIIGTMVEHRRYRRR